MPVENHFFLVVAERPKEAPERKKKKGLKPNGLQRMTGIAPKHNLISRYSRRIVVFLDLI